MHVEALIVGAILVVLGGLIIRARTVLAELRDTSPEATRLRALAAP